MRSRSLVTPGQALYRVFIQPSLACTPSTLLIHHGLRPTSVKPHLHRITTPLQSTPHRTIYRYARVTPEPPPKPATLDSSILLDERINSLTAHLVSSIDNTLGPLTALATLLENIDRATTHLRKVDEAPNGAPIVKVFTKEALRAEVRAKAAAAAAKAEKAKEGRSEEELTKQVELTWAITENDRRYRVAWMEGFLREGRRVEVLIAPKKGGRVARRDEVLALIRGLRDAAKAVEGTEEWKVMEGVPGKEVTLYFRNQGQKEAVEEERRVRAGEDRVKKMERKAREKEEKREKVERRLRRKQEEEERRKLLAVKS